MEADRLADHTLTFAQVFRDCKQYNSQGFVHLIRSPLNFKDERGSYDDWIDYYLYFNYHNAHGRYSYKADESVFQRAYIGKQYYLALLENHRGNIRVINIYDGSFALDETLTQKLAEDVDLTGEEITQEEEEKLAWIAQQEKLAALKFTPKEEKAYEPERNKLAQKSMCYLLVGVFMTVVFFFVNSIGRIWWPYKLLLILLWLCSCVGPLLKCLIVETQFSDIVFRMSTNNRRSALDKFRIFLWIAAVFANIWNGISIFLW